MLSRMEAKINNIDVQNDLDGCDVREMISAIAMSSFWGKSLSKWQQDLNKALNELDFVRNSSQEKSKLQNIKVFSYRHCC